MSETQLNPYPYPSNLPKIKYNDLKSTLETGDVFLFHGTEQICDKVENEMGTPFSHVGMVVVLKYGENKNIPLLWQSTIDIYEDIYKGPKHGKGVELNRLETVLNNYEKGGTIHLYTHRKLNFADRDKVEAKLHEFIVANDGIPFPTIADMYKHYEEGQEGKSCGDETFFCAQLVSKTLKVMGAQGTEHPDNYYSPKYFAGSNSDLDLINDAAYGPLTQCLFDIKT